MKFIIHFTDGHTEEAKAVKQNADGYIFEAIREDDTYIFVREYAYIECIGDL